MLNLIEKYVSNLFYFYFVERSKKVFHFHKMDLDLTNFFRKNLSQLTLTNYVIKAERYSVAFA